LNYETDLARELDLIEIVRIVLKYRRLIISIVAIAAVAAITYSLLTPEIWSSEATFYALGNKKMEISTSNASMSKLIRDLAEHSANNEAMTCVNVMRSRTFSEEVIHRYQLIDYFNLDSPDSLANMDDALKKLEKIIAIGYGDDDYLISLQVETKSKTLSRDIAEFYLYRLEVFLKDSRMVKGRSKRIFLEHRLTELWANIDSLQSAISSFKTQYNAVDLPQQTSQLIAQYSDLIATKMKLEVELELARTTYSEHSPVLWDLQKELTTIDRQIAEMESSDDQSLHRYRLDLSRIPPLSAKLAKLQLELHIMKVVYDYVRPKYETAVLEEQKNLPLLEIIDRPREAGRKLKPRQAMICIVTVMMAGFLATALAVVKEILVSQPERLKELKDTLHDRQDNK